MNITLLTDAYKLTHWLQRPYGINHLYSYGEPRVGGRYKKVCIIGMQPILIKYFSQKVTKEDIEEGMEESLMTFGTDKYYPKEIWERVMRLGYFPLRIKSVPEGTLIDEGNVAFTIESTQDWFAPMISHFEDMLMWNWYSSSVATRSFYIKKAIKPIFEATSDVPDLVLPVAVNDFGFRGGTYSEGAIMGGIAHLVNFRGSDNMSASKAIKDFYGLKGRALSVWATEHSVATSWGKDDEIGYIKAQLERSAPEAITSIVTDSYDDINFLKQVVASEEIKKLIIEKTGRVVLRPDSNDPLRNVCSYSEILGSIFGYSLNNKGYKVINHNVGIIQGDGMTETSIPKLYEEYVRTGWSADNVVTGSGGGLLEEDLTRDTSRWAIKLSYGEKDGVPFNTQKAPKSDMTKASKCGKLKLHKTHIRGSKPSFTTLESSKMSKEVFFGYADSLETVFENGEINKISFEQIIENANSYL